MTIPYSSNSRSNGSKLLSELSAASLTESFVCSIGSWFPEAEKLDKEKQRKKTFKFGNFVVEFSQIHNGLVNQLNEGYPAKFEICCFWAIL